MSIDANCARCGRPADKWSSNVPECWPCWYRRKLDLPAAQHWAKVAAEFLSNVDLYDLMTYLPACGLSEDEMRAMLRSARKVLEHSEAVKSPDYGRGETPAESGGGETAEAHASEADINAALTAGEATARARYEELLRCFRKPYVPGEPRCAIVDEGMSWEGERWTETHPNGDTMTIGGTTIPLSTQFLVCKDHEPPESRA